MDKDNIINSIVGEGSELKGEFKVNGVLRIDGTFSGEIKTNGKVIIGKTGHVKTDIHAGIIVIGGVVEGNVYATEQVSLLATGKLLGDIITPSLVVEEGVIFEGNCIINKDNNNKDFIQSVKSRRKDSKKDGVNKSKK